MATWTDRDLAVAGRVLVKDPASPHGRKSVLVNSQTAVCRIANLSHPPKSYSKYRRTQAQ